jgi:hypothetical protein
MRKSVTTKVPGEIRSNTPSSEDDCDSNIQTKKVSTASNDKSDKTLAIDEESSSIYVDDSDGCIKQFCPPTVNHIVNALSTVGTFGGLALIITGGMGMTLDKPVDNTMQNIAMILSGGALAVGSWIGNAVYANYQPA